MEHKLIKGIMKTLFCVLMIAALSACSFNNKEITHIEINQYFDVYYEMDDYLLDDELGEDI